MENQDRAVPLEEILNRWLMAAQRWAAEDPATLARLAEDPLNPYWFGRIGQVDQVLLVAVRIEEIPSMMTALLTSMPKSVHMPVMQAFTAWAQAMLMEDLASKTPEQRAELKAKTIQAFQAALEERDSPLQ